VSAVAFDTLKFAQTLRDKAKFSPEQAEGLSEAFSQASADQLATKSDIAELRTDLKTEIAGLRSDLKAEIAEVRSVLKAEIAEVRSDLKTEIADVRSDLRAVELRLETKIESVKSDILKWMFGTIGFQTVVILGAVLALSRFGR
jgi:gas vesicle protein